MLEQSVGEESCREVLENVTEKACRQVLEKRVVEKSNVWKC